MGVRSRTMRSLVAALVLLPPIASAQTADSTPLVSVGAGAGVAFPFHGDFDFTPWVWDADMRVAIARHVLFEVAAGEWRHTERVASQNIPIIGGGVIGRVDHTTTHVQRSLQANLLFTAPLGRVRFNAGGGVGLLQHHRQTTAVTTACPPAAACGPFESSISNPAGSVQGVGGAEIRLAGSLALYGLVRFVVPLVPYADPGASDLRAVTGLRWRFAAR